MQTLTLVVAHSNGPRCKHTDKCLHGNVMCAKRHPLLEVQSDLDHPAIAICPDMGVMLKHSKFSRVYTCL